MTTALSRHSTATGFKNKKRSRTHISYLESPPLSPLSSPEPNPPHKKRVTAAMRDSRDIKDTPRSERSHEENQERAYIAASRRSDRSMEARMESARRASEIHYKRTGKQLVVTEADVQREDVYLEQEPDHISMNPLQMMEKNKTSPTLPLSPVSDHTPTMTSPLNFSNVHVQTRPRDLFPAERRDSSASASASASTSSASPPPTTSPVYGADLVNKILPNLQHFTSNLNSIYIEQRRVATREQQKKALEAEMIARAQREKQQDQNQLAQQVPISDAFESAPSLPFDMSDMDNIFQNAAFEATELQHQNDIKEEDFLLFADE